MKIWLLLLISVKRGGNHLRLQMMAVFYAQTFEVDKLFQKSKMVTHELSNRSQITASLGF